MRLPRQLKIKSVITVITIAAIQQRHSFGVAIVVVMGFDVLSADIRRFVVLHTPAARP